MDDKDKVNNATIRKALKQLGFDKRHRFITKFDGVGYKRTYGRNGNSIYQPTVVFTDIYCDNQLVADHLWSNYNKCFADLGELEKGDQLAFNGRVKSYKKGPYHHRVTDYGIERPTKVELVHTVSNTPKDPMPNPNEKDSKNALIGYIMEKNKQFYIDNGRPYEEWYVEQYHEWQDAQNQHP